MKTVRLALPVIVWFSAVGASADERFITPRLEHDWRMESPQIQKDVDYANLLLGICDDAAFTAAVQHRFLQLDRESMFLYNRAIMPMTAASPSVPATTSPRTAHPPAAGTSPPPAGPPTRSATSDDRPRPDTSEVATRTGGIGGRKPIRP